MPVPDEIAQPGIVAGMYRGGQFVGRSVQHDGWLERLSRSGPCKFLFHLSKCRTNDVVMMNVRTDSFDRVEPHAMNQIEITGRKGRRVSAKMVCIGPVRCDDE